MEKCSEGGGIKGERNSLSSQMGKQDLHPRLTGAFLSLGLMTNIFLSKEMFRTSLHGNPIFGVRLKYKDNRKTGITVSDPCAIAILLFFSLSGALVLWAAWLTVVLFLRCG